MVEGLVEELAAVGFHLNISKTEILTTENLKEPMFPAIGSVVTFGEGPWWIYNIGLRSLG